ncbi:MULTISPECIES: sensor histidine kinase [unclassified Mycolicibacterium]|uniref:sensor histidine kinase n=1 Tax=unclassified Mycolicibacterium TaxID=2636767 RepID=UPI0012DEC695|nr:MULTISPECIES: sensor histidine kinase [unclassified Mycolicibacterium]MUL82180.1 sensor histidine kinase [Mycolicibacterium sp. CBMA 329]MUL87946.1 sensor histidine kinase [Mycolicibacterium sp. CBMA 331]MUM02277.1 sensor histidine kinase [Mycolicibacterium sp. CBMA 334]MUM26439.1 sensor histidine kinase [Mycolicibacterium sp. CBMA 295]MUM38243.1 sensor histidine kinase [Mycolicibacterium sp. CBMA 247]
MSNGTLLRTVAQPERVGFLRQLGVDTGYVLLGFPLATVSFSVLVTGLSAGLGTLVIVVGLLIIVGTLFVARLFADVERLRFPAVLRRPRSRPVYRAAPPGAGVWKRILTPLTQGQFWLDLAHGILCFPIAVVTFSIVVSWWASAIAGTLAFAWDWSIPRGPDDTSLAQLIGLGDSTFARIAFQTAIGLVCLVSLPVVVRGCALLKAGFSRALLTGVAEMRQTITVLTEQKAAAVSAEATALRRLERDIHDGPQQRLIRLAMDLGRARQHLDGNPGPLRDTLDEAISQTQETLNELRALSRGIAPPVLTDRGLPSALAALAIRCTVPVELVVDPELGTPSGRLDAAVETTAYFAVAEALTNVAKHSGAANCWVTVAHGPAGVRVEIVDDGDGGAHVAKGHGLAGLADRVRAGGGTLSVVSPAGGPTTIGVELLSC